MQIVRATGLGLSCDDLCLPAGDVIRREHHMGTQWRMGETCILY